MDYNTAKRTLNINTDRFTNAELKKAYLKKAMICHPDKNNSTKESTEQFQEVQSAYTYLMEFTTLESSDIPDIIPDSATSPKETNEDVPKELFTFMNDVVKGKYQDVILDILCGIKNVSLSALERMNKNQLQNIYDFLETYGRRFISRDILTAIKSILERKEISKELLYSVSPSLDDLLGDKLYKLSLENNTYLVPLWHNEVWYDGNTEGEDIIVSCNPVLPENIQIDQDNNLYVKISISLNSSLLNETYEISLGKKKYVIPVNQLYITSSPQTICLYNCGILKINEDDFYDISKRSNVYFIIQLY